jgi:hypothetical protein
VAGEPLSQTLRELGFRGLTKGTSATLLRDVPFNMVRWGSRLLAEKLYTDPGNCKPVLSLDVLGQLSRQQTQPQLVRSCPVASQAVVLWCTDATAPSMAFIAHSTCLRGVSKHKWFASDHRCPNMHARAAHPHLQLYFTSYAALKE